MATVVKGAFRTERNDVATTRLSNSQVIQHPPTTLSALELDAMLPDAAGGHVLELGSHFGGSTIALAHLARRVCSVDWHRGDATIDSPYSSKSNFLFNVARYGVAERICVHEGRFEDVLPKGLHGEPYDLVFLDGEHTCRSVARDLTLIFRYVHAPVIACHDYGLYETASGIAVATIGTRWEIKSVTGTLAILRPKVSA